MTSQLVIRGGMPLQGVVPISGAKNAALPILAASLLSSDPIRLENVPYLNDVVTMYRLLGTLGVDLCFHGSNAVTLCAANVAQCDVPYSLVKAMRASILALGPMLTRFHHAEIALPGGCAIGARPIDLHLQGLKKMGAEIAFHAGCIQASVHGRLKGATISLPKVTVTGTENLMMAATLAEGTTVLENAAREPEVIDLGKMLIQMGAQISGLGTSEIVIEGVKKLNATSYRILPDRIEAGTYLVAAAMTRGKVTLKDVAPKDMSAIINKLEETGAHLSIREREITLDMKGAQPKAVDIVTAPYPGFPTDLQPQFIALNAVARGEGVVTETIFENRFMHIPELQRMGANLTIQDHSIICQGVGHLEGAPVLAPDLRGAAGLMLAALVAQGETRIDAVEHLDRGYARAEELLTRLGAMIGRESLVHEATL